jgi:glutaredoxin
MRRITPFLIFLGIFIVLGIGFYFSREKKSSPDQNLKGIVLFYGIGCPHCAKVEEFIKTNKIKEKIEFEEKEVYYNKENAQKLIEIAKKCGFNENEIGVPFLWDGENQRCIVGDEPIINFFKEKLNL